MTNITRQIFLLKGPLETPLWGRGPGAAVPASGTSPGHDSGVDLQQRKKRPSLPTYSPISARSGGGTGTSSGGEMSDWEDFHCQGEMGGSGAHWPSLRTVTSSPSSTSTTSSVPSPVVLNVHGGLDRSRRRHHPFHPREVPYPRSFEREVIDLDVWDTVWLRQTCKSVTFHAFGSDLTSPSLATSPQNPIPTRVLDIGCGTGTWILECARVWKDCHFVGLDIVPLHPDLRHMSPDLAKRVTWVQANFLEELPFQNEEFDFVHVKRIARGVPEDKWDDLFQEITRVMKSGAAFEIIEEDLMFPGKPPDIDVISDARSISSSCTGQQGARTVSLRTQTTPGESPGGDDTGERVSLASGTVVGRYGGQSSLIGESGNSGAGGGSVLGGPKESESVVTGVGDGASLNSGNESGGSEKSSLFMMSGNGRSSAGSAIDVPQLPLGETTQQQHPHQCDQRVKPLEPYPILRSRSLLPSWKAQATSPFTEPSQVSPTTDLGVPESSGARRAPTPTEIAPSTNKPFPRNRPSTTGSLTTSTNFTPSSQPIVATPKSKLNAAAQAVLMETMPPMFPYSSLPGATVATARSGSTPNKHGLGLSIGGLLLGGKIRLSVGGNAAAGRAGATSPGGTGSGSGEGAQWLPARSVSRSESTATVSNMNIGGSRNDSAGNMKSPPVLNVAVPGTNTGANIGAHDWNANFSVGLHNENTPGGPAPVANSEGTSPVPPNPRDHQVLETIYNEMHAERFVNLEPFSLLANTMGAWFKDVRTHPPILFRFPPPCEPSLHSPTDAGGRSAFHSGEGTNAVLSIRDLLLGRSPYASLDDALLVAIPPALGSSADVNTHTLLDEDEWPASASSAQTSSSPTGSPTSPSLSSSSRPQLPNSTLEIDLRTLNLHLTLRVKEILTCAEAMWDWVVDFQARMRGVEREPTEVYSVIGGLTRAEFDDMLVRFDLDMREHMSLGSALQERFDWSICINPGLTPQEKHVFDTSCAKWDAYIRNINAPHQRPPMQAPSDPPSPSRHDSQGGNATTRSHPAPAGQPERGTSFTSVPHPSTRLSRSLRVFVAWKP
ncbi:hypothetical protein PAXRUDRAFT_517629 [Paxillus rubicundulus Ve08.2h10]|uniref:Methyltransferase domain-containing protein n=1 Tax=Paxillus rubicundulus Ve08.2h10 TaxID=930991 RepID=A0A0D0E0K2_9AGAM|nr:hypothetical protein PAXRUDRAFT_517629 [Paxillus rubicundulus Ve08.2h10]